MLTDEQIEALRQDSIFERTIVGSDVRMLIKTIHTLQQQNKQMREVLQKATNEIDIIHPKNLRLQIEMSHTLQSLQGGTDNANS